MKILKLWIAICLMCTFSNLEAQETVKGLEFVDVVYLKNGSVFRGTITEYKQDKTLTIELLGLNTLIFSEAEILKIRQERLEAVKNSEYEKGQVNNEKKPKIYEFRERGWYNATYFMMANGTFNGNVLFGVGLHSVTGFMLNRKIGIGLGIGVDNYAVGEGQVVYPIFVEARGYVTPTWKSLYYAVAAGYGLAFKNENNFVTKANGGYMIHPAIGMRFGGAKDSNIMVDIGYKLQKADFIKELPFTGEIDIREVIYKRISFRVGLLF